MGPLALGQLALVLIGAVATLAIQLVTARSARKHQRENAMREAQKIEYDSCLELLDSLMDASVRLKDASAGVRSPESDETGPAPVPEENAGDAVAALSDLMETGAEVYRRQVRLRTVNDTVIAEKMLEAENLVRDYLEVLREQVFGDHIFRMAAWSSFDDDLRRVTTETADLIGAALWQEQNRRAWFRWPGA